ncbi:MAG: GH92 family glycosyl hydrolase, partial [Verrucomicrobia bacterium]|nr:GH92 family glycosyl hydrolase [Verrucomicrobiota bacterium]
MNPVDYVDPSIGNVAPFLVPTFPTLHQPNQMLRTFPNKADYIADQISSFPLQVMHARRRGILQMRISPGAISPATWNRRMTIDHDLQIIKPWFYEAYLLDDDTTVRFAPGKKAGIYRFDFPAGLQKNILIAGTKDMVAKSAGANAFALEESVTYVSRNNPARKPTTMSVWCYGEVTDLKGKPVKGLQFKTNNGKLSLSCDSQVPSGVLFKYAISYVSEKQARSNFESEVANKNLSTLSAEAKNAWENDLNRIVVKGGTEAQKRTFYTALYRTHERMVNILEDGYYYSGYDERVHQSDRPFYADDGIWDTYRALHPLRTILNPAQEEDMLHSFVEMSRQSGGWMPTYARVTGNRPCMVGYHSSAIFLDAYRKGLKNFDIQAAYSGIHKNLTEGSWIAWRQGAPRTKLDRQIRELGYMPALHPGEVETEPMVDPFERRQSVAVTLGRSYDTWVLSELAKDLGKEEDHKKFAAISHEYKTLWHPEHRLYMPKDAEGNWIDIDPKSAGGRGFRDYYDENNGWTYAWYMHHDIPALK